MFWTGPGCQLRSPRDMACDKSFLRDKSSWTDTPPSFLAFHLPSRSSLTGVTAAWVGIGDVVFTMADPGNYCVWLGITGILCKSSMSSPIRLCGSDNSDIYL